MQLSFLGATDTVTGSKYLITSDRARIMIDCGLFQGYKQLRLRNWQALPLQPVTLDAVVLTHAHLDHSGYLPLLVREGFKGKIICTTATFDLCKLLLTDSGRIQEEDAAFANRHGFSKHAPALPLYTEKDALRSLEHFHPVEFGQHVELGGDLSVVLHPAGHILGAATALISDGTTSIAFSGDLGRYDDPITPEPEPIAKADYLVVESTYGNRLHTISDPLQKLGQLISETAKRGGVVVIPAFAVGRVQSMLYYLSVLKQSGAIPANLPVFLDSPMAKDATALYLKHKANHRLTSEQCKALHDVARIINSVDESMALDQQHMPMVIVSASGMATGGRVLHHLKVFAPDPRNMVIFAGYQAGGTRGANMVAGVPTVKIHGQQVPVRAQVEQISNLSAHGDYSEILRWMSGFKQAPRKTFVTHGEPEAADEMRKHIESELGWACEVPHYLQSVDL
jgi:metallo-beta-lactamase family protein